MRDLKCGLRECAYNKAYSCTAKSIMVNDDTDCTTFTFDENKRRSMFEAGSDFAASDYSIDTKVGCSANCVFQKENRCIANGITVMNQNGNEAVCLTFIKE